MGKLSFLLGARAGAFTQLEPVSSSWTKTWKRSPCSCRTHQKRPPTLNRTTTKSSTTSSTWGTSPRVQCYRNTTCRQEELELTYLFVIWGGFIDYDTAQTRHMIQLLKSEVYLFVQGFPGGSVVKNPPANAGDECSIPGSGRSLGEENGNPL